MALLDMGEGVQGYEPLVRRPPAAIDLPDDIIGQPSQHELELYHDPLPLREELGNVVRELMERATPVMARGRQNLSVFYRDFRSDIDPNLERLAALAARAATAADITIGVPLRRFADSQKGAVRTTFNRIDAVNFFVLNLPAITLTAEDIFAHRPMGPMCLAATWAAGVAGAWLGAGIADGVSDYVAPRPVAPNRTAHIVTGLLGAALCASWVHHALS